MPKESVAPLAGTAASLNELVIGRTGDTAAIKLGFPGLMSLLFPHLFTNGTDHYSMVAKNVSDVYDNKNHVISEDRGGIALASKYNTFNSYIKKQMLNADRRFARDPSFLFWAFDMKEKSNISWPYTRIQTTYKYNYYKSFIF